MSRQHRLCSMSTGAGGGHFKVHKSPNYYGFVLIFDEEQLSRISLETIVKALAAGGS
jgi:hypothetical protein